MSKNIRCYTSNNILSTQSESFDEDFLRADLVIVGKISELGIDEPEGMGRIYFENTIVDVLSFEKGKTKESTLKICYEVLSFFDGQSVEMPKANKKYTFYIKINKVDKSLLAFTITD